MRILSIETTTRIGSIALLENEDILAEVQICDNLRHSEGLFEGIEKMLDSAGLNIKDLEAIAVSAGPGSYTGIRVGMALAKGMAFSLGIPVQAVSSLAVLALQAGSCKNALFPIISAEGPEIYGALFSYKDCLERKSEDRVFIVDEIKQYLYAKTRILGPGIERQGQSLKELSVDEWIIDVEPMYPKASFAGRLAFKTIEGYSLDLKEIQPHYVKPIQLKWHNRGGK
ncbi:MAG: tRNA (adenosine(37)-N6)-threonylcarbamoyltransferase complex dimerization subunit type 1 TsaB [Candidatus Theseobacter exili]|nr:tRNA (adenosine(37)-N6)-threonylcarbamoyltransferase complex dimerization subunit type 1 TsaB [Candidatus Theseobacter exili]